MRNVVAGNPSGLVEVKHADGGRGHMRFRAFPLRQDRNCAAEVVKISNAQKPRAPRTDHWSWGNFSNV